MNDKDTCLKIPLLCAALILLFASACQSNIPSAAPIDTASASPISKQHADQPESNQIEAKYTDVKDTSQKIEKASLPQTILKQIELSNGALIVFQNKDETLLYGFMNNKGDYFQVGPIGSKPYLKDITAGEATVFGKSLIWIKGIMGASVITSDYVEYKDGAIYPFLHLDKDVAITDVDHDGENELLTQAGAPYSELSVIKWKHGQLQELSVNKALHAEQGVRYDSSSGNFIAGYPNNETKAYRLDSTTFTLIGK